MAVEHIYSYDQFRSKMFTDGVDHLYYYCIYKSIYKVNKHSKVLYEYRRRMGKRG